MSIRVAWRAFFADPDWLKKTALGAVVSLVPYVGAIVVMGFTLRRTRDVAWRLGDRLPEWRDFESYLKTGFAAVVATLAYTLPLTLILIFSVVSLVFAGTFGGNGSTGPDVLAPAVIAVGLLWLLTMLVSTLLWPVTTHVAMFGTIRSGFELAAIWRVTRAHASEFGRTWVRGLVLSVTSSTIVMMFMGIVLGGLALAMYASQSAEMIDVGMMALYPIQLLTSVASMFVSVPVALMNAHLWGDYARVAYSLESRDAAV